MDHKTNAAEDRKEEGTLYENRHGMPRRHLVGLEQSLPSLHHLFAEYRGVLDEKARYKLELEHETLIANDLESELNYLHSALDHKNRNNESNQLRVNQQLVCNIEGIHKELNSAIKVLEEQLKSQQDGTAAALNMAETSLKKKIQEDEKEFQQKLNDLEAEYKTEMNRVRKDLQIKKDDLNVALMEAELQHRKQKEEFRKTLANKMKATSHHLECRAIELDLKKQISRLEKEVKMLEQQRSKRKLPLSFTSQSPNKRSPFKSPNPKANKSPLPFVPQQISKTIPDPQSSPNYGAPRKRKLFSLNSDFLDF